MMPVIVHARWLGRAIVSPGPVLYAVLLLIGASVHGAPSISDSDTLVETMRKAIENNDFGSFEALVFWKGAGKIKRRVVSFQIRRGLGRPIHSITFEPFPKDGLKAAMDTGKLEPNMHLTHRVRVVYDEEPINASGKLPTSVFLVGKRNGSYRIGLVVRTTGFDDDGD